MKDSFTLLPEHLGSANVVTFPSFVGSMSFLVRRNRLANLAAFSSPQQLKGAGFKCQPEDEHEDDATMSQLFRDDNSTPRLKFYRTPFFINDEYGDGVLFVAQNGEHAVFDRRVIAAAEITTLYRLNTPAIAPADVDPDASTEMFTDAEEGPGDVLMVPCEVKLPALPYVAAWFPQQTQAPEQHPADALVSNASDNSQASSPFGVSKPVPASTHTVVTPSRPFIPTGATVTVGRPASNQPPVVPLGDRSDKPG